MSVPQEHYPAASAVEMVVSSVQPGHARARMTLAGLGVSSGKSEAQRGSPFVSLSHLSAYTWAVSTGEAVFLGSLSTGTTLPRRKKERGGGRTGIRILYHDNTVTKTKHHLHHHFSSTAVTPISILQ